MIVNEVNMGKEIVKKITNIVDIRNNNKYKYLNKFFLLILNDKSISFKKDIRIVENNLIGLIHILIKAFIETR